jgi:hypothetical protein
MSDKEEEDGDEPDNEDMQVDKDGDVGPQSDSEV